MSSIKKLVVLSMLAVVVLAFNMPASAAVSAGTGAATGAAGAGISTGTSTSVASGSAVSAASKAGIGLGGFSGSSRFSGLGGFGGLGTFGGFGFPFNWGYNTFGIGAFPFNWGLGGGIGPFGLGWNQFSQCFGSGSFFSPCFGGSCYQALPLITGSLGGVAGPGFGITPWAYGMGGCLKSAPLFFGAHGFGFPFTFNSLSASLTSIGQFGGLSPYLSGTSICLGMPFISGSLGGVAGPGFGITPWAYGMGGCLKSAPLFFGAHGFGFPFTFNSLSASFMPFAC